MNCPYCRHPDTKVLEKRDTDGKNVVRRRRECLQCAKRFTTYERTEVLDLTVIKKDDRRELFDRKKLRSNLLKACEKRPITPDQINTLISEIEQQLLRRRKTEIESREIGEMVMRGLKNLDQIAYIRFASVYRNFTDVTDFEKEVAKVKSQE